MTTSKLPLNKLIELMESEHRRVSAAICADFAAQIAVIPGSGGNHQAWRGGYKSHIEESMNIALIMYEQFSARRPVDFSKSQALFSVFIHDYDKLLRYQLNDSGEIDEQFIAKPEARVEIVRQLSEVYNYKLEGIEYNALRYAHGETDAEHVRGKRAIEPLGALVHCADFLSARMWFDYGHTSDSWID